MAGGCCQFLNKTSQKGLSHSNRSEHCQIPSWSSDHSRDLGLVAKGFKISSALLEVLHFVKNGSTVKHLQSGLLISPRTVFSTSGWQLFRHHRLVITDMVVGKVSMCFHWRLSKSFQWHRGLRCRASTAPGCHDILVFEKPR